MRRGKRVIPLYHIQTWDDELGWETVDTSDCFCFIGRKCGDSFCAIKIAKDYELLEGQGNVRIAHALYGTPSTAKGMVLWPLGQVRQTDLPDFKHFKKHCKYLDLDQTAHIPFQIRQL